MIGNPVTPEMEEAQHTYTNDEDNLYRPYPSKIVRLNTSVLAIQILMFSQFMLLDIIDNLLRLRLSSSHLQLILWMLNECGVSAPSFKAFHRMQEELRTEIFPEVTQPYISAMGNHFYVNNIAEAIGRVSSSNPTLIPVNHG